MKHTLYWSLGVMVTAFLGCGPAQMRLPVELSGSERLTVSGRQGMKIGERISFGSYQTAEIDRSWTVGRDFDSRFYDTNRSRQTYSFVLRESRTETLGGSCEAKLSMAYVKTKVVDVGLSDRSELFCSFYPSGEAARDWTLRLEEEGDEPWKGQFVIGGQAYEVAGTKSLQGGLPAEDTSGYTFMQGGKAVAAVEVLGDGAVVLSDALNAQDRSFVASAAVALLLAEDLRTRMEQ